MYILLSLILAGVGLIMILKPRLFFKITESWKSFSAGEPSDFYLLSTRLGGILFLVVGIAGFVVLVFFP